METQRTQEIVRTPITGIQRVPITGVQRTPILLEELNWGEVYEKLVNYIKFAAKQVSDQYNTGGWQNVEDLFQEGQLLLYNC